MTTRRSFLKVSTAAACAALIPHGVRGADPAAPVPVKGWELPRDVRITSITSTRYAVRHPRKIGLNSFKDHGTGHTEGLVRVGTSAGVEGVGNHLDPRCLGKTLGELLDVRDGRLHLRPEARPLVNTAAESTLLDLVGKLTGRSAAELLGPVVRETVPAYDGSIYMRDLEAGDDAIAKDVRNGLEAGHRRFKVKIGRGNWIKDRDKGYAKDLWAIQTVREAARKDGVVMVDANNYYNLEESVRLLKDTAGEAPLHWIEEMFQEIKANHDDYRKLRAAQKEISPKTYLADGESGRGDGDLLELLKEGTLQISQPDIRTVGIFAFRDYAEQLRPTGALVAPHVWAKHIGFLETVILGQVAPNFDTAEDCRLVGDVVRFPNLKIERGEATLARAPGLGIEIDEATYEKECVPTAKRITAD
jgi:L-alanine-DL-glutamate epimerase-like enolase superfamily enzyme